MAIIPLSFYSDVSWVGLASTQYVLSWTLVHVKRTATQTLRQSALLEDGHGRGSSQYPLSSEKQRQCDTGPSDD